MPAAANTRLRLCSMRSDIAAPWARCHDITLNERFAGPRRFEVEGADQARRFAVESGLDQFWVSKSALVKPKNAHLEGQ